MTRVSIIIPTKDRFHDLQEALISIITNAGVNIDEIIIIDSSRYKTHKRIAQLCEKIRREYNITFKLIYQPPKGLTSAINIGIKEAIGDILVKIDDDTLCQGNWLKYILNLFKADSQIGCCCVRILPYQNDIRSKIYSSVLGMDKGPKVFIIRPQDISIRSIIRSIAEFIRFRLRTIPYKPYTPPPFIGYIVQAIRRSVIDRVGLYDENLGVGTPIGGGEELDLYYRILKAGFKIAYCGKSVIYHKCSRKLEVMTRDALESGKSKRAVIRKYMRRDPYMFILFFFVLLFLLLNYYSSLILGRKPANKVVRLLIGLDLRGYLLGR